MELLLVFFFVLFAYFENVQVTRPGQGDSEEQTIDSRTGQVTPVDFSSIDRDQALNRPGQTCRPGQ